MLTTFNLAVFIIGLLFLLGMGTFICGILILAFRASSSDVKSLASQTAKLAQKGIAEDVAGLVGNASDLVDAMSQACAHNPWGWDLPNSDRCDHDGCRLLVGDTDL